MRDFLFAEFAEGKPVEVLRVGEFIDRHGRRVTISENDLDSFVAMFEAGEAGQEVPVDVDHEKSEAAGWVRRVWREGQKLLAEIDWNDLGRKLVGDRIYRYLSATIDLQRKVIKSISLVNFPAVKGLKPVELSEGVYTFQGSGLLARVIAAVVEAFTGAGEEQPEETEEAEFVIRKEGNEIVLYSSDGSKVLGRFPFGPGREYANEEAARAAALKRERQIQWFKYRDREGGSMELDWAELQGNIKHIIAAWPKWAGSFTRCVQILQGKPGIYDPEPLCAWLHKQAEGKWPAEGSEYSPTLAELEAMVDALMSIVAELNQQEVKQMDEKQLAELREQIRQELLAEMEQQEKTLSELREQVRAEVEAELEERLARRQELIEFAEELCGGEAGLSAKPDEVVAFLESLEGDQLEQAKQLLKAKVVDFSERGSTGAGQEHGKKKLPETARTDVMSGELTVADLFAVGALPGTPEEYDLSEFTAEQKGF
jgi:hypothetical protein